MSTTWQQNVVIVEMRFKHHLTIEYISQQLGLNTQTVADVIMNEQDGIAAANGFVLPSNCRVIYCEESGTTQYVYKINKFGVTLTTPMQAFAHVFDIDDVEVVLKKIRGREKYQRSGRNFKIGPYEPQQT